MLLHVLVEEPSAEPVIRRVVDAVAPHTDVCFIQFRGKHDSKVAVAKDVAQFMVLDVNRSPSFQCFVSGMRRLLGEDMPTGD